MAKKFKDTKVGQFLSRSAPTILDMVDDVFPPAKLLTKLIDDSPELTEVQKQEAKRLALEYEKLYAADRDSARRREVEVAKTGKSDWMMYLVGIIGLLAFISVVYGVMFIPELEDNKLFIHLMGMIEGVVVSNLFAYYYGTSKSSSDKTKLLGRVNGS